MSQTKTFMLYTEDSRVESDKVTEYLNKSFYENDDGEQLMGFCDFEKFTNGLCDESCSHLQCCGNIWESFNA